jgi:hypothetical protein
LMQHSSLSAHAAPLCHNHHFVEETIVCDTIYEKENIFVKPR